MGLIMAAVATRLSIQIEQTARPTLTDAVEQSQGFCKDVKRNLSEIKEACKMRAFYSVILYLIIGGLTVPSFSSFSYYFLLDEVHVSKFMYSMMTMVAYFCLMLGSIMYNRYFASTEYRKLILIDALIMIVLAPIQIVFVCRWNLAWGISDMYFIFFLDVVGEIVSQCFVFLPMSVIYAKITPHHIEATCFAMLAGVSNFRYTMRSWLGS